MSQIILEDICKSIKGRLVLDSVSLTLDAGGVYGFHGANGSGKTMLFRAIVGLIRLDRGLVTVFSKRIGIDTTFPRSLGIVIERVGFWDEYTGYINLKLLASIKHEINKEDIQKALTRVGLDYDDKRPYRKYSLGMKQRLGIAQAIMERPELILLDEPTNALDTSGLELVYDLIREEQQRGATILIASHAIDEINALCCRRFEISEGRVHEG
ncbi:MAG: ABC transporter ATP-binding protein [Coriobacteriales bacterium]|jgi:ABC-2 type transport system ATP-binding protein|nr:ABC transporter ATP-binding protein [Coriobacteriales bacterium]